MVGKFTRREVDKRYGPSKRGRRNTQEYQLQAKGISWKISCPGRELGGFAIALASN